VAAALCARAAKLPAATCPPLDFAVDDWMRAAAWLVMGVDLAEDLDIENLSMMTLLTSATVKRLDSGCQFVCRATAEEFFCFAMSGFMR
jgi:hypothetical protein